MVTQFYIVEIMQYANGEFGHLVHYEWDEDPDVALRKAESKYYSILSAAAVSQTMTHSVILFSTDAFPLKDGRYHNIKTVQPSPEEPSEEPNEEPQGE